jgi:hypothetical protein
MVVLESDRIDCALKVASETLTSRFPGAACAFVAGSIMRGQGTAASDIDLVVIFDRLEHAWRESLTADGFPVEAFVHDPETLNWFIAQDVDCGYPVMITMIAEGRAIGTNLALATALRAEAAGILARGPAPLTAKQLQALRYQITDLLDDLRGERTPAEIRAISARLYQPLVDLMLLGRGQWSGRGKWIPRILGRLEGQVLQRFEHAFSLLEKGRSDAIIALTENELERHGGLLFAGYRREAPADARRAGGQQASLVDGRVAGDLSAVAERRRKP